MSRLPGGRKIDDNRGNTVNSKLGACVIGVAQRPIQGIECSVAADTYNESSFVPVVKKIPRCTGVRKLGDHVLEFFLSRHCIVVPRPQTAVVLY